MINKDTLNALRYTNVDDLPGHWDGVCCSRPQTDMSGCVWALYQSSVACHATSDPWRCARDVPTVRGHLSFLSTHFRERAGVSLMVKTHTHTQAHFPFESTVFSFCPQTTTHSCLSYIYGSPDSILGKCVLIRFFHRVHVLLLFICVVSVGCHSLTDVESQNYVCFIMRNSEHN